MKQRPTTESKESGQAVLELMWSHNGMKMFCEVGGTLPGYFETGTEPVLSIVEDDKCFVIQTKSRGGETGSPVLAGKPDRISAKYV